MRATSHSPIPYTPRGRSCISRTMSPKSKLETLVTVFGGSGFLGRHVVRALANRGYRIRVAVRRPELCGHLRPMGRVGQIHAVQANLRYPDSVAAAARDADVVINLVGLLFERGRQRFDAVRRPARKRWRARPTRSARRWFTSLPSVLTPMQPRTTRAPRAKASGARWPRKRDGHRAAIDRVRPRGRFFQPLRRARPHGAGAAAGGRRPYAPAAGVCRRRRRGDRQSLAAGDGDVKPAAIYEFGGPDARTFKELMEFVLATIAAAACWCRCRLR